MRSTTVTAAPLHPKPPSMPDLPPAAPDLCNHLGRLLKLREGLRQILHQLDRLRGLVDLAAARMGSGDGSSKVRRSPLRVEAPLSAPAHAHTAP